MTDVIVECRGGVVQEVTVVGEPARVIVLDWDEFEREPEKAELTPWPVQHGVTTLAPETRAAYERLEHTAPG